MLGSLAIIGHQPVAQTPEAGAVAQGKTDLATDRVKSVNSDAKKVEKAQPKAAKGTQPNGGDTTQPAAGERKGSADGSPAGNGTQGQNEKAKAAEAKPKPEAPKVAQPPAVKKINLMDLRSAGSKYGTSWMERGQSLTWPSYSCSVGSFRPIEKISLGGS